MFKNILKIVILGLIGFGLLVFFTAEKPEQVNPNVVANSKLTLENLPKNIELVGNENIISSSTIFKKGTKTLVIVGNHDSLSVVKDLEKYFILDMPYVMVANISGAPWFIKKWAIPGKLEELTKGSNTPMVYDYDGSMVKSLNQYDTSKTGFFAYLIDEDGNITNIYNGKVKEDAMEGSMSEEEKKASLQPLVDLLK